MVPIWDLRSLSLGWLLQQPLPRSTEGNLTGAGFMQFRSASDGLVAARSQLFRREAGQEQNAQLEHTEQTHL